MRDYNKWIYEFNEDTENNGINNFVTCQYNIKDTYNFMYYTIYADYNYETEEELGVRIQDCYFQINSEEIEYDRSEGFINSLGCVELEVNQSEIDMRDWMMTKYKEIRDELDGQ